MGKETLREGNFDDETLENSVPIEGAGLADALPAKEFQARLIEYLRKNLDLNWDGELLDDRVSDGILVVALEMIGREGHYAMSEGRFWQLLDRHFPFRPSSSAPEQAPALQSEVQGLIAAARNESFEDGQDSALSFELVRLVLKHGDTVVQIVSDVVLGERVGPAVAAAALRCLGEMQHTATCEARRGLLEQSLECSSHTIRDGAVIGLSDLNDPRSIPSLERAAAAEKYKLLSSNMRALLHVQPDHQPASPVR